tara:strand:- start:984 stop:1766 length:783 start_codon:yes stop_codon:yes gene_type:complete
MICLSKNKTDEYINMFAKGMDFPIYDYNEEYPQQGDLLIRSIMKKEIMHDCWDNGRNFFYMDSGYLGNHKYHLNLSGHKYWHRIVKNNLQHNEITERPSDRWDRLGLEVKQNKRMGKHILLVLPSAKPCKFYDIDLDEWTEETIFKIKRFTDRPIKIREKQARHVRLNNSIYDDLKDCWALVTYQSIAAVESVISGVPAFTLAPTAADPVCDKDLRKLENPTLQHKDKLRAWAHHLAYGQFHITEMKDGTAYRILMNESS